jgi:hypothetical protein
LVLLSILPKEGNFMTLRLIRKARENSSFSDAENKKLAFVQDGDQIRWNETEARQIVKDIELGDTVTNIVIEALKKLDKDGKLRDDHFSLYEKFVESSDGREREGISS